LPVTEQTPRKDAESPYGNTKRVNEDILSETVSANSKLNAIALRYFSDGFEFDVQVTPRRVS